MDIESQLLFAVLALQVDLIDPSQLADACAGWAARRDCSLVELLLERGWLTDEDRTEVDRLLDRRLKRHGGDPRASLQASLRSTERDALLQAGNEAIQHSLNGLPLEPTDPDSTAEYVPSPIRFVLKSIHGEGGLGQVWRAHDRDLNREVVLKRIKPPRTQDPEAQRRFVREAQVTGQLEHPAIVPVYELGKLPGTGEPYYAMKMVRGKTLRHAIAEYHRREGEGGADAVVRRRLLAALLDVGNAVAYAHARGVLHRDLKPDNIVVGAFGEVIVLDWGLAQLKLSPAETELGRVQIVDPALSLVTTAGKVLGSVAYMPPEQARGDSEAIDERSDVYGLGAILFEILTGQPPHTGAPQDELLARIAIGPSPRPKDVLPEIPESLDALCTRALAYDPADRFLSASDFVAELEAWLADEPVLSYRAIVAGFVRLVQTHPASITFLDQLARSRLTLGLVLDGIGRKPQAEQAFREAITDYEQLNAMSDALPHHRADLATARSHLARVLMSQGRPVKAARMMQAAIADYKHFARLHPAAEGETFALVDVYMTLTEGPISRSSAGSEADIPSTEQTATGDSPPAPTQELHATASPRQDQSSEPQLPSPTVEEILQIRLKFLHLVARGGMSQILAAYDTELNRDVVVKQLMGFHLNDERSLQRFLREAQITAQLEHPGIVPVYGLGHRSDTGAPYLLMRRVTGENLQAAIERFHHIQKVPIGSEGPPKALLTAFVKVCYTMAYSHSRGIIHRDLKPSNIMLGNYGDVFVLDWGLAIQATGPDRQRSEGSIQISEEVEESQTMAGTIVGTPAYMSPEQARGEPTSDPSLDIYGLGATLYTILTGTHPYVSRDLRELLDRIRTSPTALHVREVNSRIPRALDAITARAMARDPADRYATADALARDIEAWLMGEPISVEPETWLRRLSRRLRRSGSSP